MGTLDCAVAPNHTLADTNLTFVRNLAFIVATSCAKPRYRGSSARVARHALYGVVASSARLIRAQVPWQPVSKSGEILECDRVKRALVRTDERGANGFLGFPVSESQSEWKRMTAFGGCGLHWGICTIALGAGHSGYLAMEKTCAENGCNRAGRTGLNVLQHSCRRVWSADSLLSQLLYRIDTTLGMCLTCCTVLAHKISTVFVLN